MSTPELVIVGAGPAGISTALHLVRLDASWRERMLVLDGARFPRPKLCAGGLTRLVSRALTPLGLDYRDALASRPVTTARFRCGEDIIDIEADPAFRVVERAAFDDWLVGRARARGVEIREACPVLAVERTAHGFVLATGAGALSARMLVGADGVRSVVRRALDFPAMHVARLLETTLPEPADPYPPGVAEFDFTPLASDVQGYGWRFPSLCGGHPRQVHGIADMRIVPGPRARLRRALEVCAPGIDHSMGVEGFGIGTWRLRDRIGKRGVLLVGDAAGVDPFVGEGIPFALAHGALAAAAIHGSRDGDFSDFHLRVLASSCGARLLVRRIVAALVFGAATQGAVQQLFAQVSRARRRDP